MTTAAPRLTKKGRATQERIVEAAAGLVLEHGVQGMTNDRLRKLTGTSGSQLNHYFPDKQSLVAAVIDWRAQAVMDFTELAAEGGLDTFSGLRAWVDAYLEREDACVAGCSFGSLAGEVMKSDRDLRGRLADGFDRWEELFRAGLRNMRDRGELDESADPEALANVLMAAFQGGMLISQAGGDPAPLRDALDGALDYLRTFRRTA